MTKHFLWSATALALIACGEKSEPVGENMAPVEDAVPSTADGDQSADTPATPSERLDRVLTAQSDETKARYAFRHPKETLEFFGVKPGMTVVDVLPGSPGWYAPILIEYLGPQGRYYGADYGMQMWSLFGGFADEAFLQERKSWAQTFISKAEALNIENGAQVGAFTLETVPETLDGTVDAVLVFRAAHHLNRFEDEGGYFTSALAEFYDLLKPGGVLGVVQHRAPEANSDPWAEGDNGYLKQSQVIAFIEGAGFELVGASEINANPADKPSEDDFVWRLAPTLAVGDDDPERRAAMEAVGESDRMTLKFIKPE